MSAATRIILIRHGVTDWNQARRFQGQIDIPLNEAGRRQASLTARRFAAELDREGVAAVHSSDLLRAAQTAEPIARALGLLVIRDPALRERRYGAFEGRTHEELQRDEPQAWQRWRTRERDFPLPGGGESLGEFHRRVGKVLLELANRYAGATVVAVTHGGVLDSAYRIAAALALDAPRGHDLLNASLNCIGFDGVGFSLVGWADVAHLEEALDDVEMRS